MLLRRSNVLPSRDLNRQLDEVPEGFGDLPRHFMPKG
jgi:hypothetical protein